MSFAKENNMKGIFTFNDFEKLYSLVEYSKFNNKISPFSFNTELLTQILLVNKLKSSKEITNNMLDSYIKYYNPIFTYSKENNEFIISENNKNTTLSFPIKRINNKKQLLLKVNSLSNDEKMGIIALMLSVIINIPFIFKGNNLHLIKLFCELLCQKPIIININKDDDISILQKRIVVEEINGFEESRIKKIIKKYIKKLIKKEKQLSKEEEITKILKDKFILKPSNIKKLIELLHNKKNKIKKENLYLVTKLKTILNTL